LLYKQPFCAHMKQPFCAHKNSPFAHTPYSIEIWWYHCQTLVKIFSIVKINKIK
jgi:hypothetical protein